MASFQVDTLTGKEYIFAPGFNATSGGTGDYIEKVTGATGEVAVFTSGGSVSNIPANFVDLSTSYTPSVEPEGRIHYDNDDKTLALHTDITASTLQIGQENWLRVKNLSGSLIENGSAVRIVGASGGVSTVSKSIATTTLGSKTVGFATHDIPDGTEGWVTTFGKVRGVVLTGYTEGQTLYLSSSVLGGVTSRIPGSGVKQIELGYVAETGVTGTLFVSVNEIHSNNNIIIRSVDDFPDPVGNTIILEDNTAYQILGMINLGSNTIQYGSNNIIAGNNPRTDMIITTASTALFTGFNNDIFLERLTTLNTVGTLFNVSATTENNIMFVEKIITANADLGRIDGFGSINIRSSVLAQLRGGFIFSGGVTGSSGSLIDIGDISFDRASSGVTFISIYEDLNSQSYHDTYKSIEIKNSNIILDSGNTFLYSDLTGFTTANTFSALVVNNAIRFVPNAVNTTKLSGIDKTYLGWFFKGNAGLDESVIFGYVDFTGNTSATTITDTVNYFKAAGINDGKTQGERMAIPINNRIVYNCPCKPNTFASMFASGDISCGSNNQTVEIAIYKNGTILISKSIVRLKTAPEPLSFAFQGIDSMNDGDYYEIFLRNTSGANNLTIGEMQFQITSIL